MDQSRKSAEIGGTAKRRVALAMGGLLIGRERLIIGPAIDGLLRIERRAIGEGAEGLTEVRYVPESQFQGGNAAPTPVGPPNGPGELTGQESLEPPVTLTLRYPDGSELELTLIGAPAAMAGGVMQVS